MVEGLSKLLKLQKDWGSILLCLYEAGRLDRVQLLDIFCEAVNPNLQTENVLFVSKVTCENLSGVKSGCGEGFIAQVLNTMRYLPMKLKLYYMCLKFGATI
jgi:origin recognition complex subunit 3